jgi:hypothetical protein
MFNIQLSLLTIVLHVMVTGTTYLLTYLLSP